MAAIKSSTKALDPAKGSTSAGTKPEKKLVPAAPEPVRTAPKKRKRLAKAFKRPLDKKLKNERMVRDSFALSEDDYAQLVELKHRLMIQGLNVKKSEVVRAGLMLLTALDDVDLTVVIDKIRCTDT